MQHKILFIFFTCILLSISGYSQIKIGDNPDTIDDASLLELQSFTKVLVITKMSTRIMNSVRPLKGAIVYNTDEDCVYTYNGTTWISLCNTTTSNNVTTATTAPLDNNIGDFWINSSNNNAVNIWDGTQWVATDSNPQKGIGIPTTVAIPSATAGDVYVDESTGIIYGFDGTSWVSNAGTTATINAENGLSIIGTDTVELGGALTKPTIISTDNNNTLSIEGLEQSTDPDNNDLVAIDQTTGQLKKISTSNILREEITEIIASNGQQQFNLTLFTTDKVNVYRNGVRIDFTIINNTTIEIEPEAICYQGDEIRVVQLY